MSLTVKINQLHLGKPKANLIARVEFRGVGHSISELSGTSDVIDVNQSYIWPLARPATPEETITVELRSQTTKILLKTGLTSPSSSRGAISSSSKFIGRYVLLMQAVMAEGKIRVEDHLVDVNNKPIQAIINFDASYTSPDDEDGPTNLVNVIVQQNTAPGGIDDDQQMLLDIEQNIANLEKSLQKGASTAAGSSLSGTKRKKRHHLLKNVLTSGSFSNRPSTSQAKQELKSANKSDSSRDVQSAPGTSLNGGTGGGRGGSAERARVSLRTVKNFIKMRKQKSAASRDSSTDDDNRSLMSDLDVGTSSAADVPFGDETDDARLLSDSHVESETSGPSTDDGGDGDEEERISEAVKSNKRLKSLGRRNDHLKSQDFQVAVTIIEARQLPGLNMDPVVCIQIGDQKKYTSVKESTNCPYYNEYFVFDFHIPPVLLFDTIITLSVIHSRKFMMRSGTVVGSFKIDLKTVYDALDHQFYHKWALLTDPEDFISGPKGYLKCDIGIIGKGDTVKIPPKSEKDPDDIEANLLLPDGVPIERQRAKFIVKIYRADGLPRMNSSIMANMKRAFTGETKDLVSPYVQVSFAGLTGKSSIKKNSYAPVWNEQLVFTEMFPPLCQRIKIQLRDDDPVKPSIIGTHYIDLKQISNDGEKGFLPTFGPSFVHLYGSTRDYSILNQHSNLNTGLGEGVSYRARLLIAIRTEITDNIELLSEKNGNVELEPTFPISETSYSKNEEFFLFSTVFEASMFDKKLHDKQVYFELSMGNAGNSLDGHNESHTIITGEEEELDAIDVTTFNSTTSSCKPISHDKSHYFLPYWDYKQCMDVRCSFPDLRRRMYNSNMIAKICERFEEGLLETHQAMEREDHISEDPQVKLRGCLEELAVNCIKYVTVTRNAIITGHGSGKTKLDKERIKMCVREVETLGNMARNLRALVTKNSMKERYKTGQNYLQKLKFLVDDPQHALPDIFIWLIANGKRIAYHRMDARDILYSDDGDEAGIYCGKVQTIFMKLPGKRSMGPNGWSVQGKLSVYFWLGLLKEKRHFFDTLPHGFELSQELRNAERPRAMAPTTIHYLEKHVFQLRAHIYQARSLIGSDASGLSDPYATVFITEFSKTTQVIEETLSPTWDELLVFDEILLYGTKEELRRNPPTIVIEIYDQDKVGKSEFIGRALAKPRTKMKDSSYITPTLEWYEITRGSDNAGELLAAFELLELGSSDVPSMSEPKQMDIPEVRVTMDRSAPPLMTLYPVPREVRPNLSRFRIEVLFWGLRDLKRVHLMAVDKPRIDVECSGNILSSNIIQNAKKNPNFSNMLRFFDLELPVEEIYAPPIVFRCVDCRSFGRYTLVGTHQISSVHRYMHRPVKNDVKVPYKTIGGQIILSNADAAEHGSSSASASTSAPHNGKMSGKNGVDNLTIYGAACVAKTMHKKSTSFKRKQLASDESMDMDSVDSENSKDWWTKYFLSYERVIRQSKAPVPKLKPILKQEEDHKRSILSTKGSKLMTRISPKHCQPMANKQKSTEEDFNPLTTPLCEILSGELEAVGDYNEFKDWLQTFPLYRGKKTGDNSEDESRIVGYFKGAVKVYKLPMEKGIEPAFGPSLPLNDPIHVLVRIYIVKGTDLHPMDLNGKADPYVVLQMGGKRISDKENYVSKQLNPIFGKCFEMELKFPQDSQLTVQIYDWDLVGSDELIGETRIDLENRFYSKHRATCGLAYKYEDTGYNTWRDPMKPTQILQKLCKDNKLEAPHYFQDHVVIGKYCMTFSDEEVLTWNGPVTCKNRDEHLALAVLHRWQEIPKVGCKIVPEHIESRPLYNPEKPGIEQGKIELWVDMFPMDMPLPPPPVDISPRKPKSYELRVVIWNTDDVVLEDDAFFTGEKMSDIYVKGWVKGPQDIQSTDIHYRSLTGEGNFNWRYIFPFEYLAAEERIVLSRRESLFSWDETEVKIPARLELQVWDADHFSADDFLGALSLNLNRFPRGAKTSKLCSLDMLKTTDNVPTVNIFKQKRVRGWWPFYVKKENEEMELTGKVEAEIHLLTKEEAEKVPAGYGRNEPDPLEKPNRPDASFMWFLNPLKSIRYIVWHNYKWVIIKGLIILGLAIMLLLFFYAVPGYSVKKMIGA